MASGVSASSSRRRSQPSSARGSDGEGQVRADAVADVEQVGQHLHGAALLAVAEQGGDGHAEELAQQVEQRRLHRRDHVVGAQVDLVGLPEDGRLGFGGHLVDGGPVRRLARPGRRAADVVEDGVVEAEPPAHDQRAGAFKRLPDAFAARHLADAGAAGVVLQHHEVAGEEGAVGAAQVQQHAVLARDGDDLHVDDGRRVRAGAAACLFGHSLRPPQRTRAGRLLSKAQPGIRCCIAAASSRAPSALAL